MKTLVRRTTLTAGALATCAGVILATSPGACAATVWTLNYNATATTTIAKMGKSVTTTGTSTTTATATGVIGPPIEPRWSRVRRRSR